MNAQTNPLLFGDVRFGGAEGEGFESLVFAM
jgi:hypothetical protein